MSNKEYTYTEVFEKSLEYFEGDELAAKVFPDKYALQTIDGIFKESNPDQMHHRLAKEFARIEDKYPNPMSREEIYELIKGFKYVIPQGSPMAGIGNPYQVMSISNCFVLNSPLDSYAGIMHTDQEEAHIMRRRGGVGFDISKIRPKGLATNNAAKTTDGIGIFMERFSNTCREVAQNGRRGALMLTISIHHPEILTFIGIKKDLKKVTGANISVRVSDEFMNAVKTGEDYQVRWPVDSDKPSIVKMIPAREIWHELISSAHSAAEPGILFWTTVEKFSPADIYKDFGFGSTSTNPCQPEWATLLTPNGITTMGRSKIGDVIWSGKQWTKITNKICTGEKEVYAYKTRAGTFYGTKNHKIVSNGAKIEAQFADSIDTSYHCANGNSDYSVDTNICVMDGLVIGDGMVHKASNNKVFLLIGEDDQDYLTDNIKTSILEHRPGVKKTAWEVRTSIMSDDLPKTYDRFVPTKYKFGTFDARRLFLRGLYSANGSVVNNRVTLKASSFQIIEDVQQMLSALGIASYYTVNKKHDVEFENGTYECKESYDLNIGTLEGRKQFYNHIGFIQKYKTEAVRSSLNVNQSYKQIKNNYEIVEQELIGIEPVYDITVEADEHTYWTGGLCVSNCGEIVLSPDDSCRLLLVNLLSFVDKPFTKNAKFNYEKYGEVVVKSQRLMDDIVDLETECVDRILAKIKSDPESDQVKRVETELWERIRKSCTNGRRTGLGITALGDALAAMNIKYGSEESIKVTEEIYKHLSINAYKSSCIMAEERGAFPVFSHDLEKDHPFLQRIWDASPEVHKLYKKHGRRNIALTTTAPAGSVSVLTQTTSGIEPAYMLSYVRRKKINPSDNHARVDFVDAMGDSWQEFTVYHPGVKRWMDVTGEIDIKKSPYWGATSNEIDWVASAKLQGGAQKWICHSISKTCNLPADTTVDMVKDVYMMAWEEKCKGFTVYREGSRAGVLISEDEHKKQNRDPNARPVNIETMMAPKRLLELPCDIKKAKVQGEGWTIFVGLLDGKPYEMFGGLSKYVDIQNKYKTGRIVKNGKIDGVTSYNLIVGEGDDEMTIKNIANVFENSNYGAHTRTISLALRHGCPPQFVVEQLQKDKHSDLTSFSKVMARVLKQYITDGTKSLNDKTCTSCSKEGSIVYSEGCILCTSCGYSKCG